MSQVHSFNVQIIINTDDSRATIVIPKGMERVMGAENAVSTIHGLAMTRLTNRTSQGQLIKSNSISTNILRTCCGCEKKTFHDHNEDCVICGRYNPIEA